MRADIRVNWVFAEGYQLDPARNLDRIKSIGPTWGSWRTWRSCGTDNVICHDLGKAQELTARAFHAVCNFYVPRIHYTDINRPIGVRLYDGEFIHDVDHHEDIVAAHLVSVCSDIVLLVGFDFSPAEPSSDPYQQVKHRNYRGLMRSIINSDPAVQWVAIDHARLPEEAFRAIPNFTCDEFDKVLELLI